MNVSGKIERRQIDVFQTFSDIAEELNIAFVVVGAAARDLVLHYHHGVPIRRATGDIDFAVQVADHHAYTKLSIALVERGYKQDKAAHRLMSPEGIPIDVVPFGPIENEAGEVAFPPDETHILNVIGFAEALSSADHVVIEDYPKLTIPVASVAGVALMKLIAWTDRPAHVKKKDAKDLEFLMKNYEALSTVQEAVYEQADLMEEFDNDLTLAAACLLGRSTIGIASEAARSIINELLAGRINHRTADDLLSDMLPTGSDDDTTERAQELLNAFLRGLREEA